VYWYSHHVAKVIGAVGPSGAAHAALTVSVKLSSTYPSATTLRAGF
jgi:hypothetical protein